MASDSRRAQLEVYDVLGMFRQAASSCRASIWLLLTLALLSSLHETAVERSAFLSGFSFSSQNSNFSFQFSFDPKHTAKSPQNHPHNDGLTSEGDSLLSRILATFAPSDLSSARRLHPERLTSAEPISGIVGGNPRPAADSDASSNPTTHREISQDEADELYAGTEDHKQDRKELDELPGDGMPLEKKVLINEDIQANDEEAVKEGWTDDSGEEDDGGILAEDEHSLQRIKFQNVNNETKRHVQEFLIDTMDLTFFTGKPLGGRGLDQGAMPHGGLTILLMFLVFAGALTIFLAIVGFQHAAVLGSVAYSVVSTHMGKRVSTRTAIISGFKSGIGRLMWLAILHATLRGLQSLFFMKTLFGGVMEMEQVEQLVLRLSVSPFAFLAPFRDVDATDISMAVRIGLFVGFDYIFEGVAYCLYAVACWVTILERDFWGLGALSRSWNLVKSMEAQALTVRVFEAMVCGRTCRWLLQQVLGQFLAAFVICTAQVYFLVLWLIFYISARSICDGPSRFSYRNLEDFLDRFK